MYEDMKQYIDKSALVAEIDNLLDKGKYHGDYDCVFRDGNNAALYALKGRINSLEVKEVDNEKPKWSPNKKQMESLKDMLKYNIGVFDYQKFMEVNSLYDDLKKLMEN